MEAVAAVLEETFSDVGKDEMLALMGGEYASPVLVQNPVFLDENGVFSPDRLKAFIQNVDADESGQLRTYWNYIQNNVHNQQYYAKYGALFTRKAIPPPTWTTSWCSTR